MSATTYNFTTVTVPAGATSHKGTSGSGSLPAPPSGTEGTQANIDNIESSNAVYWSNSPGGTPWKMFRWYDPTTDAITKYTAGAQGYGEWAWWDEENQEWEYAYNYTLDIYNFHTSAWEQLANHVNASETTITGSKSSNLSYYRDANSYVYTATVGYGGPAYGSSTLYDDYLYLTVEYTAGGIFVPRITLC